MQTTYQDRHKLDVVLSIANHLRIKKCDIAKILGMTVSKLRKYCEELPPVTPNVAEIIAIDTLYQELIDKVQEQVRRNIKAVLTKYPVSIDSRARGECDV